MGHLRHVTDWPQVTPDPQEGGGPRDATRQELLNRWGLVVVGEHPDGGWIMDCGILGPAAWGEERAGAHDGLPGTALTGEGTPADRYMHRAPAVVQAHACRAVVYRRSDGTDLRAELELDLGENVPVHTSPAGMGPLMRIANREADPQAVVAAARERMLAQDSESQSLVTRVRVAPADIAASDVVEVAAEPAHRFAGER